MLARSFIHKMRISALAAGATFAFALPIGVAQAQYDTTLVNEVTIQGLGSFTDTNDLNNTDADIDFARGTIDMIKSGPGGQTLTASGTSDPAVDWALEGQFLDDSSPYHVDNVDVSSIVPAPTIPDDSYVQLDTPTTISGTPETFTEAVATAADPVSYDLLGAGTYTFVESMDPLAKMVALDCTVTNPPPGGEASVFYLINPNAAPTDTDYLLTSTNSQWALVSGDYPGAGQTLFDGATSYQVELAAGEHAECTVTNAIVDLEVEKSWIPAACGGTATNNAFTDTTNGVTVDDNIDDATTNEHGSAAADTANAANDQSFTPGAYPNGTCYEVVITNNGSSATSADFAFADSLFDGSTLPTGLVLDPANDATCVAADSGTPVSPTSCGAGATWDVTATDSFDASLGGAGGTVIQPGGSLTIQIPVDFTTALNDATVVNDATVYDPYDVDADDPSNPLQVTIELGKDIRADIAVAKEDVFDGPAGSITDIYDPGETDGAGEKNRYIINVCNYGPSDVTSGTVTDFVAPATMPIQVTDTLPTDVTVVQSEIAVLYQSAAHVNDTSVDMTDSVGNSINDLAIPSTTETIGAHLTQPAAWDYNILPLSGNTLTVELDLPADTCATIEVPFVPYSGVAQN